MPDRLTLKNTPAIVRLLPAGHARVLNAATGLTFLVDTHTDSVDGKTVNCHVRDYRATSTAHAENIHAYCIWTLRLGHDCEEVDTSAMVHKFKGRTWDDTLGDANTIATLRAENTLLRARIEQAPIQDYTAEDAPIPSNDPVVLAELVLLPVDRLIERLLGIYDLYPGQCAPRRFYVGAINHVAALRLGTAITILGEVRKFVDDYGNWHKRIDEVIK